MTDITVKIKSDFFDNFIVSFEETLNDQSRNYHLDLALGTIRESLNAKQADFYIKVDENRWELISRDGDGVYYKNNIFIYLDNQSKLKEANVIDCTNDDNVKNFLIIPIFHKKLIYSVLIWDVKPISVGGDDYIITLQQHLKFIRSLFDFASIGFSNRFFLWKDAISSGSRSAILTRSSELINSLGKTGTSNTLDFVRSKAISAHTCISIVPHKQTMSKFPIKNCFYSDNDTSEDDNESCPFSSMARIRKKIWNNKQNGINNLERIKSIHSFINSLLKVEIIPLSQLYAIENLEFYNSVLDGNMNSKLNIFLHNNYLLIEALRTHLFTLNHLVYNRNDVINESGIKVSDNFFSKPIGDGNICYQLKILLASYLSAWKESNHEKHLIITTEWLAIWFGLQMLNSEKLFNDIEKKYSPNYRARFYLHFSCYYLYLLFLIRCNGEPSLFRFSDVVGGFESFIASSLYLISEFTHVEYSLSLSVSLHDTLEKIWSKEAVLYTVRDGYRDHFHHVWNVCLLGLVFIDSGFLELHWDKYKNLDNDKLNKIKRNWIIAGLLHDVGYCLDLNKHVIKHMDIFNGSPLLSEFTNQLSANFVENEKNLCKKLNKIFDYYNDDKLDHGISSSESIRYLNQYLNDKYPDKPSNEWVEEISDALSAIGKHNLTSVTIDPNKNPLDFLLILCDHLQEWDRPRLQGDKLRRSLSAQLHRPRQGASSGSDIVRYLQTNFSWNSSKVIYPHNLKLKLTLYYKDSFTENFEPALIWSQNTYDFQRVNLNSFPNGFNINFNSYHVSNEDIKKVNRTEMELFEDFCREDKTRLGMLQWCFFSKNNVERYKLFSIDDCKIEIFSLNFSNDSIPITIDKLPKNLYNDYSLWKEKMIKKLKLYELS